MSAVQDADDLTLDASRQSKQIANHLERVAQERWGTEAHGMSFNVSGGNDFSDTDDDESEDEDTEDDEDAEDEDAEDEDSDYGYEVTIARNGNTGVISAWERLDEHFLREAASVGRKPFLHTGWMVADILGSKPIATH